MDIFKTYSFFMIFKDTYFFYTIKIKQKSDWSDIKCEKIS